MNIGAVRIGSRRRKSLRKRERVLDREKRRRAGEKVSYEGVESDDGDEEMEDALDCEAMEKQRIEQQEQEEDDADSDYGYSSESSFDDTESVDSNGSDLLTGSFEILDVALRPRTPEPEPESTEEVDSDSWSQASELELGHLVDSVNYDDNSDEEDTFDPRLLRLDDYMWINRCRALAINDQRKAYISGRGRYNDYGYFDVMGDRRDPNDPGDSPLNLTSYNEGEENQAFPFHEACFDILAKSIGLDKGRDVDRDVMWEVIRAHLGDQRPVLELDYKIGTAQEQFWCNNPGQEYVVCDPSPHPALQEKIQDMLPANVVARTSAYANLTRKVRNDPTNILPYDTILEIFGYMNTKDMKSFMRASYHIHSSTRETAFWKHMVRIRILPWFYELRHFLETISTDALDYKGLFLWADALTRPEFGNQGPLMHVANRRRIWDCCQPLASLYKRKVGPVIPAEPEDSEEAKAILDSSMCLHMPMTMYPPPEKAETVSAQLIHAWNEITHHPCILDTYWRRVEQDPPYLVGISITLGGQRRLFGSSEGILGRPLYMERGEWIKQIICKVELIEMFNNIQDRTGDERPEDVKPRNTACISGMQVSLTTGKHKVLKQYYSNGTQRPLLVLDGMHLVGLKGQIASNGAISRLGLLQASRPDSAPLVQPQYTPTQRMAWAPHASWLPINEKDGRKLAAIWSDPFLHHDLLPASTHPSPFDPHEDVRPNDTLMWNETAIECFQPVATSISRLPDSALVANPTEESMSSAISTTDIPTFTSSHHKADISSSPYQFHTCPDIVGIQPEPYNRFGGRGRGVGHHGPVLCQHPKWAHAMESPLKESIKAVWEDLYKNKVDRISGSDRQNIATFSPDESITEVHVEQQYRALKLVTRTGQVGYFGEPDRHDWFVRKAVPGERFVGISTCFGALGGWSESAKMWSHWKLSRVGVLFERVDGEGKVVSKAEEKEMRELGVVFEEGKVVACSG